MKVKYFILTLFAFAIILSCAKEDSITTSSVNPEIDSRNNDVWLCHKPDGKNPHDLNVNENAVQAHLNHGDYLLDADGDGYTAPNACEAGSQDDCDDSDASVNPGSEEICGDGIDNNCDGNVDEDCCCWEADYPDSFVLNDPRFWNYNQGSPCGDRGKTLDIFICFDPNCGDNFIWIEGDPGSYQCWSQAEGGIIYEPVAISDEEAEACSNAVMALAAELGLTECDGSGFTSNDCNNCPLEAQAD